VVRANRTMLVDSLVRTSSWPPVEDLVVDDGCNVWLKLRSLNQSAYLYVTRRDAKEVRLPIQTTVLQVRGTSIVGIRPGHNGIRLEHYQLTSSFFSRGGAP